MAVPKRNISAIILWIHSIIINRAVPNVHRLVQFIGYNLQKSAWLYLMLTVNCTP